MQACSIRPTNLRCEYIANPTGIDVARPRFSWELQSERRAQIQTAYRIVVAGSLVDLEADRGDKWDSGKIASGQTFHIEYAGKPLLSGERCYWKVICWDGSDVCGSHSEPATFSMGLLGEHDWHGDWIGGDAASAAPLFRRAFELEGPVKRAVLYICGLGYYELFMNGRKVGDHVLDPNWTNYDTRRLEGLLYPFEDRMSTTVLYVTYDVTGMLLAGGNTIGVMLGNGWYSQRERTIEGNMAYGTPKFRLQLNIELADGRRLHLFSDESWKYSEGPILFNNIYYGEVYDAREEQEGWNANGFDDRRWAHAKLAAKPSGRLKAQMCPPDKIIDEIRPIRISEPRPHVYIADLGENISGWASIVVTGESGCKVTMRYAETLDESGNPDYRSTGGLDQIQTDVYLIKGGGEERYEPRFTWHGFRYVEVTGYPGKLGRDHIRGVVVHAAVERTGVFACSDPLINEIQACYVRSQLTNLHGGVPSDCPHRERLGYTGDGQITAEAALFNLDMAAFYTKWVQDIIDAQNKATGFVPHTAPFYGGGGGPGWGSAIVIIPWFMYLYYGDRRILDCCYNAMAFWIDYLSSCTDGDCIIVREEPGSWCLGDWCAPGALPSEDLVNTFYYSYVSSLMEQISLVLGKHEQAERYKALSAAINAAFNRKFLNKALGQYATGAGGSAVFPLVLGIVPEAAVDGVLESLADTLMVKRGGHLDTGIFGTKFLFDMLTDYGYGEMAYELLHAPDDPGYAHMMKQGATTLWENWNGEGSRNHPMFGAISGWFYRVLAGISPCSAPSGAGFRQIGIKPHFLGDLTEVRAEIHAMTGIVAVHWIRRQGSTKVTVRLPANTRAVVNLPMADGKSDLVLESGTIVWQDGTVAAQQDGISGLRAENGRLLIEVGSGTYRFELRQR